MTEHLTASEELLLYCGWLAHEASDEQVADKLYRQTEDIWMNGNATDMYEHYKEMKKLLTVTQAVMEFKGDKE